MLEDGCKEGEREKGGVGDKHGYRCLFYPIW